MSDDSKIENAKTPYRVLALKYRPQNFDELIGQDALVRTLTNAIETGRIAHAFMLTGVRGVGKTTTARIIAKALNYKGPDGNAEPTTKPTDDCELCQAISEDRHPDVIEMDAATHTGVDDIREILDGVRYAPTEARYKVYIIDEVHMLSKQAFNALLKTLEEPPPHVKFIFATTEIRKVPITVLSRCQRFDLRRVDIATLKTHFENICEKEGVTADDEALSIICRAADGSVRDGLSLLDQAIALSDGNVSAEQVKNMLGLGDRGRNIDLLDNILSGKTPEALQIMDEIYAVGGDPSVLIQDLLDCVHNLTKLRAVPDIEKETQGLSADEKERLKDMATKLTMPTLGKAWQILLKGLNEVNMAANPQSAAEMVVIRLSYAAGLPDPADLIKQIGDGGSITGSPSGMAASAPSSNGGGATAATSSQSISQGASEDRPLTTAHLSVVPTGGRSSSPSGHASAATALMPQTLEEAQEDDLESYQIETMEDVVHFLEKANEMVLAGRAYSMLHFVKIEQKKDMNVLEVRPEETAPEDLASKMAEALRAHSGTHWMVTVSGASGQPTLAEQAAERYEIELQQIKDHPMMREVFALFPEAEIVDIKGKKK